MADMNFNAWNDDEYQKFLEPVKQHVIKSSQITWQHQVMNSYEYINKQNIPIEQDENGMYGYKVLIRTLGSQWLMSPNRFHGSAWVNNKLHSHVSPTHRDNACGIYASKNMELLKEWWDIYQKTFDSPNLYHVRLFAVKIRVWGIVVEHTKGLRAEYAEILEVLRDGHW